MEFSMEHIGDVAVVTLQTEVLDAGNIKHFKNNVSHIMEAGSKVVLNMEMIKFIDSSGCGAILTFLRNLNDTGGELKLFGVQKTVHNTFELIHMDKVVEIYDEKQNAIDSFKITL